MIITKDFMLKGETAKKLYHTYAENMPIIDYHCHLVPKQIAENYRFRNITDLFLGGDHYKWRQMRTFGIEEKYITGDAPDYDKFIKYAEMMPYLIGNPIFHWTHLELKRYFDIDDMLCPETADAIWEKCNALLATEEYSARNLIVRSNVKALCTTDDPIDSLEYHKQLREEGYEVKVLPTFRPDKLINIDKDTFVDYIGQLGATTYEEVVAKLRERIAYFHDAGCRLSDHGVDFIFYGEGDAKAAFDKAMRGEKVTREEADAYKTALMLVCSEEYTRLDWTMQIHMGALRNNNTVMFNKIGADTGFDSINDDRVAEPLSKLLNAMNSNGTLPKTILYNLNPKDNYVLATMLGNFQSAPYKGKIQFGSGWWFNDQRDGMEAQMKALGNLGMLSCFVGMLTDSRSFVSYPRHEYFRRILCNLLGEWVDNGEYPANEKYLGEIVQNICYRNADSYFGF